MNAEKFLSAFVNKLAEVPDLQRYGKEWTEVVYPILRGIGESEGWAVNCNRGGHGELFRVDFMYFPQPKPGYFRASLGEKDTYSQYSWYQPKVAIEHENAFEFGPKVEDFWKVCMMAVPLRVFIGYSKNKELAKQHAAWLERLYLDHELQNSPGAKPCSSSPGTSPTAGGCRPAGWQANWWVKARGGSRWRWWPQLPNDPPKSTKLLNPRRHPT